MLASFSHQQDVLINDMMEREGFKNILWPSILIIYALMLPENIHLLNYPLAREKDSKKNILIFLTSIGLFWVAYIQRPLSINKQGRVLSN